ncbi:Propionate catabolism operon regulatory protein [Burkholderia pseudomallei]|nr:Propionate catabolism operon regulatory protein [Burkholderia pseudomallei]VBT53002.1 Propionate catabolism operon regulatory protein [Burkholderia pseudomallei]VBV72037.1 Propionate catabolism operon regulatory protein [Burkholderia pseudomallei]VBV94696.1 Propionate catabolism operon regulatory protein [Burkholderia pseudomallei]VBW25807.1 Propionate catabolism operon regulatory protein [Burkholderia pseudomallei]
MTDFAASPRTRSSRSSPARRRPRAAAASGPGQSRAAARPGRDAAAGDASRDEHTLDLFGTAFEENARTDEAAAGVAVDETAHDAARVQARGFGGLDRPGRGAGADADADADDDADADARGARAAAHAPEPAGEQADLLSGFGESPAADRQDAQRNADGRVDAEAADGERSRAVKADERLNEGVSQGVNAEASAGEHAAAGSAGPAIIRRDASAPGASEPAAAKSGVDEATAARPPRARRASARRADGGKQAAERGARRSRTAEDAISKSAGVDGGALGGEAAGGQAAGNRAVPADTVRDSSPAPVARRDAAVRGRPAEARALPAAADRAPVNAAQPHPRSANPSPALLPAAAAQAATSAASADSDAQLRPLADRIRALQSETIDLRRAADAQMRRVNRLLLALAVVLLAAIVAWIVQAVQLSRQRDQFAAMQQRIDRLVAAQATQGATIATLSQRQDEVGAQVDRLTSRLSSTAVPAKRAHRTRHMR